MRAYLLKRLLQMIPTLLGITFITFCIIQLAPGNPAMLKLQMASQGEMADTAYAKQIIEQTKKLYGLDKPLPVQYALWVKRVFTLDFGTSFKDHRRVLDKIAERLPVTIQINVLSIFLVYLIAIPFGVYSATHPDTLSDRTLTLLFFFLYSLPNFWVAVLLIMLFGGATSGTSFRSTASLPSTPKAGPCGVKFSTGCGIWPFPSPVSPMADLPIFRASPGPNSWKSSAKTTCARLGPRA